MPDEPGVGLEHVRMMPLEKRDPVPGGAGASPGALHDSGPTPASIARGSRDSITVHCVEVRGGVLWCFAGSLDFSLEDLSGEGTSPLLGSNLGNLSFPSRNRLEMGFNWATEGNPIRAAAAVKGSSPGDGGTAKRFRPANGDEDCRSNPATVPDRSSPTRRYPPEARTMAAIPARTAAGRRCQTAARSASSGGIASASIELPSRSAWAAAAPATPPPKTALLRPPYPVAIRPAGRQRSPGRGVDPRL